MKRCGLSACLVFASAVALGLSVSATQAPAGRGRGNLEPGPTITVRGHTFTQLSLFQRNVGGPDDMTTPFPPHKVIGNIYYVGTKSLAAFLIVTPQGNILINSTYERNVPAIQKSVEQLGFKFSDIKILLGSHAHGDHQEGDALVKQFIRSTRCCTTAIR
jgi:metallo-beta-lactamase class B